MAAQWMRARFRERAPSWCQSGCSEDEVEDLSSCSGMSEDDSVFESRDYDRAVAMTTGLCRDYVCYRLKRSGYDKPVYTSLTRPASDHTLSNRVLNLGCAFENLYPRVYGSLSKQVGQLFCSEPIIRRLYVRLGTHILGPDSRRFTWGKILSLFCIAGAMAVDCVAQGNAELVECVIAITSDYMRHTVLDWVLMNGGWATLVEHFDTQQNVRRGYSGLRLEIVPRKYVRHALATAALTVVSMLFLHDCERLFF